MHAVAGGGWRDEPALPRALMRGVAPDACPRRAAVFACRRCSARRPGRRCIPSPLRAAAHRRIASMPMRAFAIAPDPPRRRALAP
jgi:hypothetical protein